MRVFFRLLSLAAWVVTIVAVIQWFNGAPFWVVLAWGAIAIVLGFAWKLVPPNKTVQMAWTIARGGLEQRSVAAEVEAYLRRGANPNWIYNGEPVICEAAVWGEAAVVRALVAAGASTETRGSSGTTPLHIAASNAHLDLIETLIAVGANIDTADNFGHTALHRAAFSVKPDSVRLLLQLGADPNLRDRDGETAADIVQQTLNRWTTSYELSKNYEVVNRLREIASALSYR